MKTLIRRLTMTALAATLVLPILLSTMGVAAPNNNNVQHVLLISVDGMHQVDLELWVMYGRRPRCKRNLTLSETFGCSHVSGL